MITFLKPGDFKASGFFFFKSAIIASKADLKTITFCSNSHAGPNSKAPTSSVPHPDNSAVPNSGGWLMGVGLW